MVALIGIDFANGLSITNSNDAFTAIRQIRTPWPLIVGEWGFTVVLMLIDISSLRMLVQKITPIGIIVWIISMIRVIGANVWTIWNITIRSGPLPSIGTAFMSVNLFAASIGRCHAKDAFTRFVGYTGLAAAVVALVSYVIGGAFAFVDGGEHSVLLIVTNGCGTNGTGCDYIIHMDMIEELEGGDFLAIIAWGFGTFFCVYLLGCFLWWVCKQTAEIGLGLRWGLKMMLAFLVFLAGGLAIAIAVLNSKTFVLTSTDCTNAVWVTNPIFGGGNYNCMDANITLPGSTTGFWDLWVADEIAIIRSVFAW
jgi:hypothetical protein